PRRESGSDPERSVSSGVTVAAGRGFGSEHELRSAAGISRQARAREMALFIRRGGFILRRWFITGFIIGLSGLRRCGHQVSAPDLADFIGVDSQRTKERRARLQGALRAFKVPGEDQ